jgi:hypothetical protein
MDAGRAVVLVLVLLCAAVLRWGGPVLHAQEGHLVVRDRCQCWVEPDGTWVCGEQSLTAERGK